MQAIAPVVRLSIPPVVSTLLLALTAALPAGPAAAGDAEALFVRNCGTCHAFEEGAGRRAGPNLWGVYAAEAASVPDFPYTDALAASGLTWDEATLDRWLTDAGALVPGTIMTYRQDDPAIRQSIIEYLKTGG